MAASFITETEFAHRLRHAVSAAWIAFARKAGAKLIPINKEASAQLQYAYLLRQLLPLACQHTHEHADIELESSVHLGNSRQNIDILLIGRSGSVETRIAIEMKCYRTIAASGGVRGAQNIFMKDVYEDLQVLERYVTAGVASQGVALVMTDHRHFVHPAVKRGDCWAYDTSDGHYFPGGQVSVPIAGKPVDIRLQRHYRFAWLPCGPFWFMELEGV
ncbi:MAG: hypothetical protein IBJ14_09985 [Hydrogenophaga sp.]|nr:hypothetical protein [Hydrogenophaga sp.]